MWPNWETPVSSRVYGLKLCCLIYSGLPCIMQQYCNVDIATVVNDINKRLLTPLSDVTS